MKLSVVIVNYNVKYFLEQCLRSVYAAAEGIDTDVWVVDNNSIDGSVQMIREKFPEVHLIANSDNPGFAKANNQAIREILNGERRTENGERKAQERRLPACKRRTENYTMRHTPAFGHPSPRGNVLRRTGSRGTIYCC